MSLIERKPSFFRVGGLEILDKQKLTAGKNQDGTYYIDIKGPTHARAQLTPEQTFTLCSGLLNALGYKFEKVDTLK